MSETVFRVATCKPRETLERAERLREVIGVPEAVIAPSFRRNIRVGRARQRQVAIRPVLGGVLFIAESAAAAAKGSGGVCSCRSREAAVGGVVQMLTPWKDPVTGDRDYARVGVSEIAPLIEYAEARDREFREPGQPRVPIDHVADAALVGRRVTLTGGLLAAVTGMVTAVRDGMAALDLDAGGFGSSMTVPTSMLRVAE